MRAVAIINEQAGTVLELGSEIVEGLADRFRARGHELEVQLVSPEEIEKAIRSAAARPEIDAVIVGGGDGSQSLAASLLAGTGKALGVLPLGTMNLLARDLEMPFDLMEAVDALAESQVDLIDLGNLNGRTFHSLAGLGLLARLALRRAGAESLCRSMAKLSTSVRLCASERDEQLGKSYAPPSWRQPPDSPHKKFG